MNLREAFETIPKRRGGKPCVTCVVLRDMPDDDADTFRQLLSSEASSRVIAEACRLAGYSTISEGTVKRHRRGDCVGLT